MVQAKHSLVHEPEALWASDSCSDTARVQRRSQALYNWVPDCPIPRAPVNYVA